MKKMVMVSFMALVFLLSLSAGALAADPKIKMRLAMAIPSKLPGIEIVTDYAKMVELMSNGSIRMKVFEPGKLVPAFEIQEAVSKGRIEAGWGSSVYISGKIPAAALFLATPFGGTAKELMAWLHYGNGLKLWQEMYDIKGFNVKVIPLLMGTQETGGWFNKKIESVEDLKGLRMRMPGLGGKTLAKLGASVSTIPIGECFPALEKGAIDGMELGSPILDVAIGPYKVTKYNYFPGWHQPTASMELVVNKDIWNKMSKAQQAIMAETAIASSIRATVMAEVGAIPVMKDNEAKRGIKNMKLTPEVLAALQKAWLEVAEEESAKDPFFKKVWTDQKNFLREYEYWREHTSLAMPPRNFK